MRLSCIQKNELYRLTYLLDYGYAQLHFNPVSETCTQKNEGIAKHGLKNAINGMRLAAKVVSFASGRRQSSSLLGVDYRPAVKFLRFDLCPYQF